VHNIWTAPKSQFAEKRVAERHPVTLPARLTWKDQRGTARFATVVARNVSDYGVFIECSSPLPLSLFRLVQFQFERDDRSHSAIPQALREGRTLAAVYRITPPTPGRPQGVALRLMVDPKRQVAAPAADRRATA
jgi:hypothetical protein